MTNTEPPLPPTRSRYVLPEPIENTSMIELALQDLQVEREACVGRLREVLQASQHADEAQGYLRRIDNINAALVRLASARLRN